MAGKIILDKIDKCFGQEQVLKSCSACFESGHIYGIVGRNGSGKTVLMKIMCGLCRMDSGAVFIDGKSFDSRRGFMENVGVIIETPGFLNRYSGYENLKYLAQIRRRIGNEEIKMAMEQVGLEWDSKKRVGKYSLGMKQRLGIAQAIMENPEILLLDEPTNGLDASGVEDIRKLLLQKKEEGRIIILSSHIKEDISYLADKVYELREGKLEFIH